MCVLRDYVIIAGTPQSHNSSCVAVQWCAGIKMQPLRLPDDDGSTMQLLNFNQIVDRYK